MHSTVALLSIITGIANVWRFITLMQQRRLLLSYDIEQALTLTLIASMIWSCCFVIGGIMTWQKRLPSRILLPIAFLCYTLYNFFWLSPTRPFVVWHLFLTIFTTIVLNVGRFRPKSSPE
ncbi:MAG: hypothetical protein ACPG8W_02320 [Candidatus Promineifilaceae bacterium]